MLIAEHRRAKVVGRAAQAQHVVGTDQENTIGRMKSKGSTKKSKTTSARPKAKAKPAARKAAAKAPAARSATPSAPPKAAVYTPKPIEGIGWAPFRYSR